MAKLVHFRTPRIYYWWKLHFLPWWQENPSLTRFLPRWVNKRIQYWGERRRSEVALAEPETNLPFPYNDSVYLQAYCLNRQFAEPDFESYWQEQQRLMELKWVYRRLPGPVGYKPELSIVEEPQ